MNSIKKTVLKVFSSIAFLILIMINQVYAGQNVVYACRSNGCTIENNIKTTKVTAETRIEFHTLMKRPIQKLLDRNLKNLAGVDLQKLVSEIQTIDIMAVTHGYVAPQGRMSGLMYNTEQRTVFFHAESLSQLVTSWNGRSIDGVLLHEGLGALGYVDDDYQVSSLIVALGSINQNTVSSFSSDLTTIKINHTKRLSSPSGELREVLDARTKAVLASGGSTTVGGGGDPLMSLIKSRLVGVAIENQLPKKSIEFILNSVRLERPFGIQEFAITGLAPIRSFPLSYQNFLTSIQSTQRAEGITLLLGVEGDFTPLDNLEEHLLEYLRQNRFIGSSNEKK